MNRGVKLVAIPRFLFAGAERDVSEFVEIVDGLIEEIVVWG